LYRLNAAVGVFYWIKFIERSKNVVEIRQLAMAAAHADKRAIL